MDTTNELKQHEVINEIESAVQSEVLDETVLKDEVLETIVDLVDHAKAISAENNSVEEAMCYEDVDDPKTYIDKIEGFESEAKRKYSELEKMKEPHFWTIGRNKAKAEKTQEILSDIIGAINNNAYATKALFNNQVKLAVLSQKLYGLGIMGIAANRLVVREIKKRLEHASQEELNELARHELESVVNELQQQQRLEKKVDDNHQYVLKKLESAYARVESNREYSEKKFEELNQKSKEIRNQLLSVSKEINVKSAAIEKMTKDAMTYLEQQYQTSIDNQEKNYNAFRSGIQSLISNKREEIDKELKQMKENQDWFKKDISKTLDEKILGLTNLHKQFLIDQTSIINKLTHQVNTYKIVAAIATVVSLASLAVAIVY